MKKLKTYILGTFIVLLLHSCISLQAVHMNSVKMDKLELGMSREQVIHILGKGYTISEKRLVNKNEIEVLSYRDTYKRDEFYLFVFENKKLKKWYRKLLPQRKEE